MPSDFNEDAKVKPTADIGEARHIFDVVCESMTIKDAAAHLNMDPQDLYNWFWALRRKFYKRLSWCNAINGQRSRSKLLQRVLTDRKHGRVKRLKAKTNAFLQAEALDREREEDEE
jgi:hypothetical protein